MTPARPSRAGWFRISTGLVLYDRENEDLRLKRDDGSEVTADLYIVHADEFTQVVLSDDHATGRLTDAEHYEICCELVKPDRNVGETFSPRRM